MKSKRWPTLVGLTLVFFGLPAFLLWNFFLAPVLENNARFRGLLGKPEAEVIRQLGPPLFRENPAEAKAKGLDYPWRQQHFEPVPDRPVHKEVLLYLPNGSSAASAPFAVYVFIGTDGNVEAIDFAGTG